MSRKLVVGVLAVLVFVIFLVISIPARFAMQFVDLPAGVQIGGVEGTLWRGQIDAVRVNDLWLREITWQVRPSRLLTGQIQVQLELSDHIDNMVVGQAQVIASTSRLRVRDAQFSARVTDLASYAPEPSPFPLRGDVVLHLDTFELGQPACAQAQGRVELVGGAFQVGQNWESLGELNAELSCEQGWLSAELAPNTLGLSASMRSDLASARGEFQISQSAEAPRSVRNIVAMLPEQARRPQRFRLVF